MITARDVLERGNDASNVSTMASATSAASAGSSIAASPDAVAECPFEGPEKLLEIWLAQSPASIPWEHTLRDIPQDSLKWMLESARCEILSSVHSHEVDAYVLSESSLFVFPHRIILKTCGTTTPLYALERLEKLVQRYCGKWELKNAFRVFYSRRAFLFPHRQLEIHRRWDKEVAFLEGMFAGGESAVLGEHTRQANAEQSAGHVSNGDVHNSSEAPVDPSGDHWHIYVAGTDEGRALSGNSEAAATATTSTLSATPSATVPAAGTGDYTLELLMTDLDEIAAQRYYGGGGRKGGRTMMGQVGLDAVPTEGPGDSAWAHDAHAFAPCGFSSNSLRGENYYTVHVTPEKGWSYASFETNAPAGAASEAAGPAGATVNLAAVLRALQPRSFVLTLCTEGAAGAVPAAGSPASPIAGFALAGLAGLEGYRATHTATANLKWYSVHYVSFVARA